MTYGSSGSGRGKESICSSPSGTQDWACRMDTPASFSPWTGSLTPQTKRSSYSAPSFIAVSSCCSRSSASSVSGRRRMASCMLL